MSENLRAFEDGKDNEDNVVLSALLLPTMHAPDDASTFSIWAPASAAAKPLLKKPVPFCLRRGIDNVKFVLSTFVTRAAWFNAPGKWGFVALPKDTDTEDGTPQLALVLCVSPRKREVWCLNFNDATSRWSYRRPDDEEQGWLVANGYVLKTKTADAKDDDALSFGSYTDTEEYDALRDLVFDVQRFVNATYGDALDKLYAPKLDKAPLEWRFIGPAELKPELHADNEKQFNVLQSGTSGTAQLALPPVQLNVDHTFVFDLKLPHKTRGSLAVTYVNAEEQCVSGDASSAQQVWCVLFQDSNVIQYGYDLRALVLACTRAG